MKPWILTLVVIISGYLHTGCSTRENESSLQSDEDVAAAHALRVARKIECIGSTAGELTYFVIEHSDMMHVFVTGTVGAAEVWGRTNMQLTEARLDLLEYKRGTVGALQMVPDAATPGKAEGSFVYSPLPSHRKTYQFSCSITVP